MKQRNHSLNIRMKNKMKIFRSIMQVIVLIMFTIIFVRAIYPIKTYEASDEEKKNAHGFIALSYSGVGQGESSQSISRSALDKQLTYLQNQGYQTISQQDLIDFYEKRLPLPEKALYLSFEDGRTDSSVFAQTILEKLNYKATMFTYADKLQSKDTKFLKAKHLKTMMNSEYWELGSNGLQLAYINAYDNKGNYLGVIDEVNDTSKMKVEYYNHYLMDFLRDEYMIPRETKVEMEERIVKEYELMNEIYTKHFDQMPQVYALMHANTMYNQMDPLVEKVNDEQVKKQFKLHFNNEGFAYNSRFDHMHNLNRLQVSPYWSMNHLLMKIRQSKRVNIDFEIGDEEEAEQWEVINGVAEFLENKFILTSEPSKEGKALLKQSLPKDYRLQFDMNGNIIGEQSVFLAHNDTFDQYIRIMLKDNYVTILEKLPHKNEKELTSSKLNKVSWDEEAYAFNKATVYTFKDTQNGTRINEDEYPRTVKNKRTFTIEVVEDEMHIQVDQDEFTKTIPINEQHDLNTIGFGASYSKKDTEYEQYTDDIYDAIIENIHITNANDELVYTNEPSKVGKVKDAFIQQVGRIIDLFVFNF